ncbi:ribonuclease P/MRP protein subunit POP8 [Geosmithia morbida]|uniref:Ribonuclease P/MRP protein subunit POP8 n=1 Tax=Geosmithia morbida TaxID=1094350 RepID=A0A9P5D1W1_9HYPO|nr:ribonuclease P/MRP protein subunit POP8 [Geosmithia morbida]KAF4120200.1 ribonuclease P/MRP protein subunit POP8 [Geosmithia morbida]
MPETSNRSGIPKSHDILTCTIRAPQFSYAHLELITGDNTSNSQLSSSSFKADLDPLQVKTYCTSALRQFLGLTGAAVSVDVLKVQGSECWVRVPRDDLASFAAAMTAWRGAREDGMQSLLRLRQCSDWLGAMVGSHGQEELWNA